MGGPTPTDMRGYRLLCSFLPFFFAGMLILFPFSFSPHGQDPVATPIATPTVSAQDAQFNEMKRNLERAKELAELEAQIAESKKKVLDAMPTAKASPKSGTVIVSGEDLSQDVVVYRELKKATDRVADSLRKKVPKNATIAIFNPRDFADWSFYRRSLPLFKIVIEDLTEDYCLVARSQPIDESVKSTSISGLAGTISGAGNIVGQFADLLSYLKTDTTAVGKSVTISEESIVASLFSELDRDEGLILLYPNTFAIDSPIYCGNSTVTKACCGPAGQECTETRQTYCSEVANLLDRLYRARRAAFAAKQQSPELRKLENYFAEFLKLVSDATPANAETALKKYVNAEQIAELQKRNDLYYLEIKSLRAVGVQRTRKNLFFLSDRLDYSGGVILQWTLFDKDGRIRDSGIETSYNAFVKPQELRDPQRP